MKAFLLKVFNGRIISPWWILAIDWLLISNAFIIAYVVRLNVMLPTYTVWEFLSGGAYVAVIYSLVFYLFGIHRGVIRHTSFTELRSLVYASAIALALMLVGGTLARWLYPEISLVPRLVLVLHFMLVVFFCFGFRLVVKIGRASCRERV